MTRSSNSRRDFLRAGCGLLACGGASTLFPQLNLISSALAGAAPGYKALVCLYLGGGNDSWNLLIPGAGAAYDQYVNARNGVYNTQGNTGGLALPGTGGQGFVSGQTPPQAIGIAGGLGLNPFCPELASLYSGGRLAFISNVGPLVEPITRATYQGGGARRRPPQLYSHNDQTNLWHIGTGSTTQTAMGWGGRVAGATSKLPSEMAGLPPTITLAGQSRFLAGQTSLGTAMFPFTLSTSASSPASTLIEYGIPNRSGNQFQVARAAHLQELLDAAYPQAFTGEYKDTVVRSRELASNVINPAFRSITANDPVNTPFANLGNVGLFNQLRQVARMIKVSTDPTLANPINANRQVFFVNIGGFDTHDAQITGTGATGHHLLLQRVSQGINAFFQAMQAIGRQNDVTLFTASEFARTINSNGSGSDHAWGGVQMVVGGAVNGGQVYGRYPSIVLNNTLSGSVSVNATQGECFSRGQFIPTVATDQLAASLAQWMGVPFADLPTIFPNIDNFASGPFANAGATPTFSYFSRTIPGLMAGV